MGRPGRPGLGKPPGLAEFPTPRPSLGLGFARASAAVVLLPGPIAAHAPFLVFTAARWARARPPLCAASQRSGGKGVGAGGEGGGGAAGPAALELAREG